MTVMHILMAASLMLFVPCGIVYFRPLVGWRYKYAAAEPETLVTIPKRGRFEFAVIHWWNRIPIWDRGEQTIAERFKLQAYFLVHRTDTNEEIRYNPDKWASSPISGWSVIWWRPSAIPLGYFDVPAAGVSYRIETLSERGFPDDAIIIIRRHLSTVKLVTVYLGFGIGLSVFLASLLYLTQ